MSQASQNWPAGKGQEELLRKNISEKNERPPQDRACDLGKALDPDGSLALAETL